MILDGSKPEDLALIMTLVPDWVELADGLDLTTEDGAQAYQARIQRALDARQE
jgi:hypothetical protein